MRESLPEEYAWVTAALAADDPGPMPAHVNDRILGALGLPRGAAPPAPAQRSSGAVFPVAGSAPERFDVVAGPFREAMTPAAPPPASVSAAEPDRARRGAVLAGGRRSDRAEAASDRRHFLTYRLLPVAAAMVVIATASGVVATQFRDGGTDDATIAATSAEEAATIGPRPNGLVATGTAYTSASLAEQAATLVGIAAGARTSLGDAEAGTPPDSAESSGAAPAQSPAAALAAPDPFAGNPLGSAAAFQECARTLGAPAGVLPTAVDLATFDGVEAAVVVLPNRAGDGFEVIVTDRFCNPDSERASTTFVGG